jgi:endoglucanase
MQMNRFWCSILIILFLAAFNSNSWSQDEDGDAVITNIGMASPQIITISVAHSKRVAGDYVFYDGSDGSTIDSSNYTERKIKLNEQTVGYLIGKEDSIMRTFDKRIGDKIYETTINNVTISSDTDNNYTNGMDPVDASIKSRITDLAWTGDWQMSFCKELIIYLEISEPLIAGHKYNLKTSSLGLNDTTFVYNPRELISTSVHVNHLGFNPSSPVKVGFLSCWAGNLGALSFNNYHPFYLINHETGSIVYTGVTQLSKSKDNPHESDLRYGRNFTQTDVYFMDFTDYTTPGYYRLCVEDVGCSLPFRISGDVYKEAMSASTIGLFTHRSGLELGEPFTDYIRPRPMHPDDGNKIFHSTMTLSEFNDSGMDFEQLLESATEDTCGTAWGGYMDAGDWDRHTGHLIAPRMIFELLELFPTYYDTVQLNIPENNNDLPDMVDEALWSIDLYRRMQNSDGSVPGGIESSQHPRRMEPSWHESLKIMVFKPDLKSAYRYAATAAKAAFWFQQNNNPQKSKLYKNSALKAYRWAEQKVAEGDPEYSSGSGFNFTVDKRNLAAAELFRLTDADSIHNVFLATTVYTSAKNKLEAWNSYSQKEAPFTYIITTSDKKDLDVHDNCIASIKNDADDELSYQSTTAFRWSKDPNGVLGFGAITAPRVISMLKSYHISNDDIYLEGAINGCQYTLGANPLNMTFTTGLGHKYPTLPLHLDSYNTGQKPPTGITVYGSFNQLDDFPDYWSNKFTESEIKPAISTWPPIEYYQDIGHLSSFMCEYTIQQTIAPHLYVMGFLNGLFADEETYEIPEIVNNINQKTLAKELQVYPNPCRDAININVPNELNNVNVEIYNLLGELVLRRSYPGSSPDIKLNISTFNPGTYLIKMYDSNNIYQVKILKTNNSN